MIAFLLGFFDHVAAERRIRVLAGALDRSQRDLAAFRADLARALDRNTEQAKLLDQVRGERSSSPAQATRNQRNAFTDALVRARAHGADTNSPADLHVCVLPETSPGRGHELVGYWADESHVMIAGVDRHGNYRMMLGEVEWIHNDSDEDLACLTCVGEQEADRDE